MKTDAEILKELRDAGKETDREAQAIDKVVNKKIGQALGLSIALALIKYLFVGAVVIAAAIIIGRHL